MKNIVIYIFLMAMLITSIARKLPSIPTCNYQAVMKATLLSVTLFSIPFPANSVDVSDIYNIRGFLSSVVKDIDNSPEKYNFELVDKLLNQYNVNYRLQVLLNESPESSISCARASSNAFKYDLYTIVEYFSVSNGER